MDTTIKIFHLIEAADSDLEYGYWAFKTSIPNRYIQMIVDDIIEDVKCDVGSDWCLDDVFDRLPPEWEAKDIDIEDLIV